MANITTDQVRKVAQIEVGDFPLIFAKNEANGVAIYYENRLEATTWLTEQAWDKLVALVNKEVFGKDAALGE